MLEWIGGNHTTSQSLFGAQTTPHLMNEPIMLADACQPLTVNASGHMLLVDEESGCTFAAMLENALQAGAVAVIFYTPVAQVEDQFDGCTALAHGTIHTSYNDNAECVWTLSCPDPESTVSLSFSAFEMENGCKYLSAKCCGIYPVKC
eukprot:SAG31_NODE_250_length_19098_cov_4.337123_3_plen_148_part_00